MTGASFKCPNCKQWSGCNCSTCAPILEEGKKYTLPTENGEAMMCPYCKVTFSYDQWLDEEWAEIESIEWGLGEAGITLKPGINRDDKSKD